MVGELHQHAHLDTQCPTCGRENYLHSDVEGKGASPAPGDVAICWRCKEPARFETTPVGQLRLRALNAGELAEVQADQRYRDAAAATTTAPTVDHALAPAAIRRRRAGGASR